MSLIPGGKGQVGQEHRLIAPRLARGNHVWGTYHFTAGGVTTWHGFGSRAVAVQAPLTSRNPRITPNAAADYPTVATRPVNSQLDCSPFANVFGVTGRHWIEGVDATARALVASARQRANVA